MYPLQGRALLADLQIAVAVGAFEIVMRFDMKVLFDRVIKGHFF